MPQLVLAQWFEMSRQRLARIEHGQVEATVWMVAKAASGFDVNARYLLGLSETSARAQYLRDDEKAFLTAYNKLTPEGRDMALRTIGDILTYEGISAQARDS